jgi:hypothetical protein
VAAPWTTPTVRITGRVERPIGKRRTADKRRQRERTGDSRDEPNGHPMTNSLTTVQTDASSCVANSTMPIMSAMPTGR